MIENYGHFSLGATVRKLFKPKFGEEACIEICTHGNDAVKIPRKIMCIIDSNVIQNGSESHGKYIIMFFRSRLNPMANSFNHSILYTKAMALTQKLVPWIG